MSAKPRSIEVECLHTVHVNHKQLIHDLVDDLAKGTVLVVAGTGVSIQASGNQPCATWEGLIRDGIDHCVRMGLLPASEANSLHAQLPQRDVAKLLDVADKLSRALGAPEGGEFRRWLQRSVGRLDLRHPEIISAIHDLGVPIATLNYDDLLVRGRNIDAIPWTNGPAAHEVIRGDRRGVLHFHGYYDNPESVVLGIRSYDALLASRGAQTIQQVVVANRTLLFVGCGDSLSDPNIGALLDWSTELFTESIYRHYYLCREGDETGLRRRFSSRARLYCLPYGQSYDDLVPFLREQLRNPVRSCRQEQRAALPQSGYCIGRAQEVEALVEALLEDDPQPLPLLGGPGMGKTTVALKALHDRRVAARYGARRWLVRCDGVKSRAELAAAIAAQLGLPITPTVEQAVLGTFAEGRGALVIDNAETPLDSDAQGTEELLAIFAAIELLALIVVIRGHRRPRGVRWRSSVEPRRLEDAAAREVFLAVSGKPAFGDDPRLPNLLAVLDGVPLAITLMARYAEVFDSLEPVWLVWSQQRVSMLADGYGDTRDTSIAVSYELSVSVLSPGARYVLSTLALLPNGVELLDLARLIPCSQDSALELRARAMVFEEATRLRMLAPFREYVATKHPLTSSDVLAVENYYANLAFHEGNRLGRVGGSAAIARLRPEVANIDRALASYGSRSGPLPVGEVVTAWSKFMKATGLGSTSVLEHLTERLLEDHRVLDAAQCYESLGDMALVRPSPKTGERWYRKALSLYRMATDRLGEANSIAKLGDVAYILSDYDGAQQQYEKARTLYSEIGWSRGEATVTKSLGSIAFARSDFTTALALYSTALTLFQKTDWMQGEAACYRSLGDLAFSLSNHEQARELYERARRGYASVGSSIGEANCLKGLADLALECRSYEEAARRFIEVQEIYRRVGDLQKQADCVKCRGDLARYQQRWQEAAQHYETALGWYEAVGARLEIGFVRRNLARLAVEGHVRTVHLAEARAAWRVIRRDELIEELEAEFGGV